MAAINAGNRRRVGGLAGTYGLGHNVPEPSAVFDFTRGSLADALVRASDKPFTFTRADASTCATYFGADGVLRTAAANVARFDHVYDGTSWNAKGLLIEGARTNSLLHNRDFSNAAWTDAGTPTVETNTGIDGLTKSIKITDNQAGARSGRTSADITIANDGATHTASVFILKSDTADDMPCLQFLLTGGTALNAEVALNTATGVAAMASTAAAGTNVTVEDWGDWWRLWVNLTNNTSGNTIARITLRAAQTNTANFPERANEATRTTTFDFPMVELNVSFPSSPIETGASTVTRAADVCTLTGLAASSWFNASEGTIFAEGDYGSDAISAYLVEIANGTGDRFILWHGTDPTFKWWGLRNTAQFTLDMGTGTRRQTSKVVGTYALNDFIGAVDGTLSSADTSGLLPISPNTMSVGGGGATVASRELYGHISRLIYWNRRLPNETLEQITA